MFKYLIQFCFLCVSFNAFADVKWKTEDEIRSIYGEPIEINGPTGTHASYQLWDYDRFYIAFSNGRAFHRFGQEQRQLNSDNVEEN